MFELARQLEQRGVLRQLLTAHPRRSVTEVSGTLVRTRPWLALPTLTASRLTKRPFPLLDRTLIADFDRWAARELPDASVVTALSSFGTRTLGEAARRGSRTVCDRGSWHIADQARILAEEAESWGVPTDPVESWVIDRELQDYETADRIVVPSEPALASFLRNGVKRQKLHKVPFGVDLERFRRLESGGHPAHIITVGPISLRKGHQYLVPAYRRVRRFHSRLILLGKVDKAVVARLGIVDDDIEVAGTVSKAEVPTRLGRCGIFVLASVEEGLALAVPQAMASGLPVIITDATGGAEFVTSGAEGLVVPARSEDALAEALDLLLASPELARSMGEAGRRRMQTEGGWAAYGDRALRALTGPDQS